MISKEQQSEVFGVDKDSTMSMIVDSSNSKILMMVLSQNLYSDPIGSIIREYTTNALDSHREAGVEEPIIVSLVRENGKFVFSIQDFGTGLSPDRVENVFAKYLSSTKRESATQLGFYGLGSKSALSYCNSFNIISRYEGKEYQFLMFKDSEGSSLTLQDINDTTERNGVTIKIPLKTDTDYFQFIRSIKEQLCYFEGVYFRTEYSNEISNDFRIVKGEDWKYSELNTDKFMHLSLDNVYYKLDFQKLGISPIKMPIAISLSLNDGITPIPNRESITYSPEVKELILSKIKKIGTEFIGKWNEIAPSVSNLNEAKNYQGDHYANLEIYEGIRVKVDRHLEVICDLKMKAVTLSLFPNLPVGTLLDNISNILQEYQRSCEFYNGTYSSKYKYESDNKITIYDTYQKVYLLQPGESLNPEQIKYLRWLSNRNSQHIVFVRKHFAMKLGKFDYRGSYPYYCYRGLLALDKKPKDQWRAIIEDFIKLVESYTVNFLSVTTIDPSLDQSWLDYKAEIKADRKTAIYNKKDEITYSTIRKAVKGKSIFVLDESTKVNVSHLTHKSYISVYLPEERIEEFKNLEYLITTLGSEKKIKCIVLSCRNYEKLQKLVKSKAINLPNWIHFDDFFKSKNRELSKKLTIALLRAFWYKEDGHFNYSVHSEFLDTLVSKIDRKIFDKYSTLNRAAESYRFTAQSNDSFVFKILKVYYDKRWLNNELINSMIQFLNQMDRFSFLNAFDIDYHDTKLLVKLSRHLYLRQCRIESLTGSLQYNRYNYKEKLQDFLCPDRYPELDRADYRHIYPSYYSMNQILKDQIKKPIVVVSDVEFFND